MHEDNQLAYCPITQVLALAIADDAIKDLSCPSYQRCQVWMYARDPMLSRVSRVPRVSLVHLLRLSQLISQLSSTRLISEI